MTQVQVVAAVVLACSVLSCASGPGRGSKLAVALGHTSRELEAERRSFVAQELDRAELEYPEELKALGQALHRAEALRDQVQETGAASPAEADGLALELLARLSAVREARARLEQLRSERRSILEDSYVRSARMREEHDAQAARDVVRCQQWARDRRDPCQVDSDCRVVQVCVPCPPLGLCARPLSVSAGDLEGLRECGRVAEACESASIPEAEGAPLSGVCREGICAVYFRPSIDEQFLALANEHRGTELGENALLGLLDLLEGRRNLRGYRLPGLRFLSEYPHSRHVARVRRTLEAFSEADAAAAADPEAASYAK